MSASPGHPQAQTVGAWLLSLGPGDLCPCCGARLEVVAEQGALTRRPVGVAQTECGCALMCSGCGCHIDDVEESQEPSNCRALDAAA